jgi:hypothetical protein
MEAVRIAAGATVLTGSNHLGFERVSAGISIAHKVLSTALKALDAWHESRVAAHNDALVAQLATHDHRVLEELRAAYCRTEGQRGA